MKQILYLLFIAALLPACSFFKGPKYQLADGYYRTKLFSSDSQKVYVLNIPNDTLEVIAVKKSGKEFVNNTGMKRFSYPSTTTKPIKRTRFVKGTVDVDLLTIPFKLRPAVSGFPRQFTTSLNGALYLGYRTDNYSLFYKKTPMGVYRRTISHFGFSGGIFGGLGSTQMNPWVTNYNINIEYEGLVFSKGIAAIVGIENYTIGICLGFDSLLDSNRKYWYFQQKPWVGLGFGVNIN